MRSFEIEGKLKKILKKLYKKDRKTYEIIIKKIGEIVSCKNVEHYKNLRSPLQYLKSVHIHSSFILTFKYIKEKDFVIFYDFSHHNDAY